MTSNAALFELEQFSQWPSGVAETPADYVFLRPRLYLDTTIPSYVTGRPSQDLHTARLQRIASRWWNSWRTNFDIYVSDLVVTEAAKGHPDAAQRRLALIKPYVILKDDNRSKTLAGNIMSACDLPARAEDDATHVAIAAIHSIEFLLTWNCTHLANPHFTPGIAAACEFHGYKSPTLCTPQQLMVLYENVLSEG